MRLETFVLAALLTAPAIKEAFVDDTMPVENALLRYVIALFCVGVGMGFVRSVYYGYAAAAPRRRMSDKAQVIPGTSMPGQRAGDVGDSLAAIESPFDKPDEQQPPTP